MGKYVSMYVSCINKCTSIHTSICNGDLDMHLLANKFGSQPDLSLELDTGMAT